MTDKQDHPINVPSVADLAELYRKATATSDTQLASIAESAVAKLAAGEAAITEAQILFSFVAESSSQ